MSAFIPTEDSNNTVPFDEMNDLRLHSPQPSSPTSDSELRGDLSGVSRSTIEGQSENTLDEPVRETLMRDVRAVANKLYHVLYPRKSQLLLRDWDLWGPLTLCVSISLLLHLEGTEHSPHFTQAFLLMSLGACVVTLNTKLLGGTVSFFQCVCVLGYCLLPCAVALLICRFVVVLVGDGNLAAVLRILITAAGFSWATFASTAFLSGYHPQRRRALVLYPIFLFYFVVSWLVMIYTH